MDNNPEWAQGTKDMIDQENGISEVIQADVTDEESCRQAVAKTVDLFGSVCILVNIGKVSRRSGRQRGIDMYCSRGRRGDGRRNEA